MCWEKNPTFSKPTVSFSYWLFSVWTAARRRTFGSLSNASCALENQEWPVHTATYLPKWSWRLINTCNPFLCRVSKWDFKSSAKPHASHCVWDSSGGKEKGEREISYQSPPEVDVIVFFTICNGYYLWCVVEASCLFNGEAAHLTAYSPKVIVSHTVRTTWSYLLKNVSVSTADLTPCVLATTLNPQQPSIHSFVLCTYSMKHMSSGCCVKHSCLRGKSVSTVIFEFSIICDLRSHCRCWSSYCWGLCY